MNDIIALGAAALLMLSALSAAVLLSAVMVSGRISRDEDGAKMEANKYMRVRRVVPCICYACGGSGYLATKHGLKRCPDCINGDVEKWLVEFVTDEQEQEGTP